MTEFSRFDVRPCPVPDLGLAAYQSRPKLAMGRGALAHLATLSCGFCERVIVDVTNTSIMRNFNVKTTSK
jgi:hypothetical protein